MKAGSSKPLPAAPFCNYPESSPPHTHTHQRTEQLEPSQGVTLIPSHNVTAMSGNNHSPRRQKSSSMSKAPPPPPAEEEGRGGEKLTPEGRQTVSFLLRQPQPYLGPKAAEQTGTKPEAATLSKRVSSSYSRARTGWLPPTPPPRCRKSKTPLHSDDDWQDGCSCCCCLFS